MSEANKALGREFYDRINAGDAGVLDTNLSDDFVDHEEFPGVPPTKEGARQFFAIMRNAFPDFRMEIEDLIAEGDRIVARITISGTHQGAFIGVAPTGKKISVSAIDIMRVVNGKVTDHWGVTDTAAMMMQLGVTPPPSP